MRVLLIAALVGMGAGRAAADTDHTWDGTYVRDADGGSELCPHIEGPAAVKDGAYAIPWNIRTGNDKLLRVGMLNGTVRASGLAKLTPKVFDPMAKPTVDALVQMSDSVDDVKELGGKLTIAFRTRAHGREFEITGNNCYARWVIQATADDETPVKPAAPPKPAKAPPPMAAGAAKWDSEYLHTSHYGADWRCPLDTSFETLMVKKGRFTMPYVVQAYSKSGGDQYPDVTLGQIDGSIPANGKVTLRTTFSVDALPPEITEAHKASEGTLDYVRAFKPTMTFTGSGKAMYATLAFGKDCEFRFQTKSSFKPGRSVDRPTPQLESHGDACKSDSDCSSGYCASNRCDDRPSHHDDDDDRDDDDDDGDDDDDDNW